MLQYLLTGLAGLVLGVVAMRVWQARDAGTAASEPAGGDTDGGASPSAPAALRSRKILIGAAALALLAIAVLVLRNGDNDGNGGTPGVAASAGDAAKPLDDVDSMMSRLAQRLEKNPGDGEGFRMLGWSYVMTGHPDKAIAPYKRAAALLPDHANVHAGYGEALVGIAKGTVTPEAKAAFDRAITLDRSEPRARFFEGLWLAQHGQEREALEKWIALANSGPADAPWQADLRRRIGDSSAKLGVDVSSRLKSAPIAVAGAEPPPIDSAAMQAASALPPGDRQAMIDQMVEGLAAKLKTNPRDPDGWIRLLRSRMVLKQTSQASGDLAMARQALAGTPSELARVNAAARELAVPDKP